MNEKAYLQILLYARSC